MSDENTTNNTFFSLGSSFNDTNLPRVNDSSLHSLQDTITEDDILRNINQDVEVENDENRISVDSSTNTGLSNNSALSNVAQNSLLLLELNHIVNNEKLAPDLLPSSVEKIEEIVNLVRLQKTKIKKIMHENEVLKSGKASGLQLGPGGAGSNILNTGNLTQTCNINNTLVSIMSMEISRIEYLLKCYYRARLSKIEQYAVHYRRVIRQIADRAASVENENAQEQGSETNLTEEERDFYERFDEEEGQFVEEIAKNDLKLMHDQVSRHLDARMEYYQAEKFLPRKWPRPNEGGYCFARVRNFTANIDSETESEFLGPLELPDMSVIDPVVGKIYLLPFSVVKKRLDKDIVLM